MNRFIHKNIFLIVVGYLLSLMISGYPGYCTPPETLDEAIRLYQGGSYTEALTLFKSLNQDLQTAGLFYNIGNCYIKLGRYGEGIAAYASARRRDKNNAALIHNLTYAHTLAGSTGIVDQKKDGLFDVYLNLIQYGSFRFHQILFLCLYGIFIVVLAYLGIYRRSFQGAHLWWTGMLFLIFLEGGTLKILSDELQKVEGVVIEKKVTVRYGPSILDTEAFVLPEGTLFTVHNTEKDWVQIQLDDGKVGWLEAPKISIIK